MYREIRKKMVILQNRFPFSKEVSVLVRYMQKRDWVFLNLKLEGSQITQVDLEKVLKTDVLVNLPIEEYILIRRLEDLYDAMIQWGKEGRELSKEMVDEMYRICAQEEPAYRKSNPVILQWAFTPILPLDMPNAMESLIKSSHEDVFNPLEKAAKLHNDFLKIYPYGRFNQVIARCIMYYYVLCKNLPIAAMEIKEEEYNSILYEELNKVFENSRLSDYLVKATLNTLQIIENLTKRDN